jgi:hypothetical protein
MILLVDGINYIESTFLRNYPFSTDQRSASSLNKNKKNGKTHPQNCVLDFCNNRLSLVYTRGYFIMAISNKCLEKINGICG